MGKDDRLENPPLAGGGVALGMSSTASASPMSASIALMEDFRTSMAWTKEGVPGVVDPAVEIEIKKRSLVDELDLLRPEEEKRESLSEWNKIWHTVAADHQMFNYKHRIKQLTIERKDKSDILHSCSVKTATAYSDAKAKVDKLLAHEEEELKSVNADRCAFMDRVETLKSMIKVLKKRQAEGERQAEVEEQDFSRFKEQYKVRSGSTLEEIEQLDEDILGIRDEIEALHDDRIEEMFSQTSNTEQLTTRVKKETEEKLRKQNIQAMEKRLQSYREEDEALRESIVAQKEKIRTVSGKTQGRVFVFSSVNTAVKRLRQSVATTGVKLKETRSKNKELKTKLRDLIEKDSLSPILLATITEELGRARSLLSIEMERLHEAQNELSELKMEESRTKTTLNLEKNGTFLNRMKREKEALEKEIGHNREEETKITASVEKLSKKEQALKDEIRHIEICIERCKKEKEETSKKIRKCNTDIIRPGRLDTRPNDVLLTGTDEALPCGVQWSAHPLQLKLDRLTRTSYQHEKEKEEVSQKLEETHVFAQQHIDKMKINWEEEERSILEKIKIRTNWYLMNEEDVPLLKERRQKRIDESNLLIARYKLMTKDRQLLVEKCNSEEEQLNTSHSLLSDARKQFNKSLAPQLKKLEKVNAGFHKEVKVLEKKNEKFLADLKVYTDERDALREIVERQEKQLETLGLDRNTAKERIANYNKTFADMTAPLHAAETDRELQRQMSVELGKQGIDSMQEISRIRQTNGELRAEIESILKLKKQTALYHELNANGEWTKLRVKLNKGISRASKETFQINEEIVQRTKVVADLEKKADQAKRGAQRAKDQEMSKLRKQMKTSVMKTAGIVGKQRSLKGFASMALAAKKVDDDGAAGGFDNVALVTAMKMEQGGGGPIGAVENHGGGDSEQAAALAKMATMARRGVDNAEELMTPNTKSGGKEQDETMSALALKAFGKGVANAKSLQPSLA